MAGRPERPLDAGEGPLQRLACELRTLRGEAGSPTYRRMAALTGAGASTLSQAAAGERLPTLATVLAYVRACGGDVCEWERRWRLAAREIAAKPRADQDGAEPPYRGLRRFEPGDADLFFGRTGLTAQLAATVGRQRLVAVVGASGSGKSSLLRAGLVPALRAPDAPGGRPAAVRILTPGPRPASHARAFEPAAGEGNTVVLVDQFEELFTLGADPGERGAFLGLLLAACAPGSRLRAVIAVRADFFGRCAEHAGLAHALREATVLVGPMSPAELREAVVGPAAAAGLVVERELTAEVVGEAADQPGSLPLLSHALLETWRRRRGRTLTLETYRAAGGIHRAIARSAEEAYSSLTPAEAAAAREILLRMVTPGEGTPDTRRPTDRVELGAATPEAGHVLEVLARARLITPDDEGADLAHEALITAWPRYRSWIDDNRERLRAHRRLTEAARAWHDLGQDPGALYRGTRLAAAEEVFTGPGRPTGLTALEKSFLDAALAQRDQEARTAARTAGRLRALTATLAVLLVLATTAGLIAWQQSRDSERRRQAADAARRTALSRQLAAQSAGLLSTDPDLASLLAVRAYRTHPTAEAAASLYAAASSPLEQRLSGHTAWVGSLAFSPDGHTLATASDDGTVRLWDTATGRSLTTLARLTGAVASVVFGPDGRSVATGGADRTARLWDLATGRAVRTWHTGDTRTGSGLDRHEESVAPVAFTDGGHTLATGQADGTVLLRDTATGRTRSSFAALRGGSAASGGGPVASGGVQLVFSADGRTAAALDQQAGTLRLWDVPGRRLLGVSGGYGDGAAAVALSRDGRLLAVGDTAGTVRLRDTATGHPHAAAAPDPGAAVSAVAISTDRRTLAIARDDRTVSVVDTATGRRTVLPGRTNLVVSAAFSPDGRTLATGAEDGTVRLWKRPRPGPGSRWATPTPPAHRCSARTDACWPPAPRTAPYGCGTPPPAGCAPPRPASDTP